MGVTAVLNAAQGSMTDWNYVNTKDIFYTGVGMEFLGIPAIDLKWYPICNHFEEASNFIQSIVSKGGKYSKTLIDQIDRRCSIVCIVWFMVHTALLDNVLLEIIDRNEMNAKTT